MPITIPSLIDNLKGLKSVRRTVVVDADDATQAAVGITALSLLELRSRIDQVLDLIPITKAPDSSKEPILFITVRVRSIASGSPTVQVFALGASINLRDEVLLPRTYTWTPPVTSAKAPTNASADTWTSADTAALVLASKAKTQLTDDVDRLMTSFYDDWSKANP
jgi:hypothetical protein